MYLPPLSPSLLSSILRKRDSHGYGRRGVGSGEKKVLLLWSSRLFIILNKTIEITPPLVCQVVLIGGFFRRYVPIQRLCTHIRKERGNEIILGFLSSCAK